MPSKATGKARSAQPQPCEQLPDCFPAGSLAYYSPMSSNTNVLAQGIEIIGTIKFQNDMIIDGKVEGEIQSEKGKVTIGENARIKGDVKAGEVKMFGTVEGTIQSDRCELRENSELRGDITTKSLKMEEGALLSGKMQTGQ